MSGLDSWIKEQERPNADSNAQSDIEGRVRKAVSYGGVSRHPTFGEVLARDNRSEYERRYVDLSPFERAWYSGASVAEAIAAQNDKTVWWIVKRSPNRKSITYEGGPFDKEDAAREECLKLVHRRNDGDVYALATSVLRVK